MGEPTPPPGPRPFTRSEIIRDDLAGRRTAMANERTLLSYVRTALTFFIAGVTFIKFFGHAAIVMIGWIFLPVSLVTLAVGVWSHRRTRRAIDSELCREREGKD